MAAAVLSGLLSAVFKQTDLDSVSYYTDFSLTVKRLRKSFHPLDKLRQTVIMQLSGFGICPEGGPTDPYSSHRRTRGRSRRIEKDVECARFSSGEPGASYI